MRTAAVIHSKRWRAASRVRRRRVWSSALAPPPPVLSLFDRIMSLFRPINSLFGAIKFAVISTIVACHKLSNPLKRLIVHPIGPGRKRDPSSPNSEYQARNDPQRSGRCARRPRESISQAFGVHESQSASLGINRSVRTGWRGDRVVGSGFLRPAVTMTGRSFDPGNSSQSRRFAIPDDACRSGEPYSPVRPFRRSPRQI